MPEDHTYYGNRSAANMMIGRYDHVEKDCVKAVELNRDYTKCYLRLAKARLALGKFDQAEDSLTQLYLRDVRSTDVPNERKKVSLSRAGVLPLLASGRDPAGDYRARSPLCRRARPRLRVFSHFLSAAWSELHPGIVVSRLRCCVKSIKSNSFSRISPA